MKYHHLAIKNCILVWFKIVIEISFEQCLGLLGVNGHSLNKDSIEALIIFDQNYIQFLMDTAKTRTGWLNIKGVIK